MHTHVFVLHKNVKTNKAPGGVEPSTFCLLGRRSNQLSYRAATISGGHFFVQHNMHSLNEVKTTRKRKIRIPGSRDRREDSPTWIHTNYCILNLHIL